MNPPYGQPYGAQPGNPYGQTYGYGQQPGSSSYGTPFGAGSGNPYRQGQAYAPPAGAPYGQQNMPPHPFGAQSPQMQNIPIDTQRNSRPSILLPDGRGLLKMIFLGIITLGIYDLVILSRIPEELNIVASRYDGRRTLPFFAMLFLTPFTLCILPLVWYHNLSSRIGRELNRRRISYDFGASSFWLWNILGSLILVGPFIYLHKLMRAMNLLNADFNLRG